ncbi:MAG: hypothetical protein ACOYNB_10925 [Aquabacterium sp.]|uniref:hypothetical protein n=1 Tax=Aquabacterium sp. TaxID=1872578 RepID=UPI003BCEFD14
MAASTLLGKLPVRLAMTALLALSTSCIWAQTSATRSYVCRNPLDGHVTYSQTPCAGDVSASQDFADRRTPAQHTQAVHARKAEHALEKQLRQTQHRDDQGAVSLPAMPLTVAADRTHPHKAKSTPPASSLLPPAKRQPRPFTAVIPKANKGSHTSSRR